MGRRGKEEDIRENEKKDRKIVCTHFSSIEIKQLKNEAQKLVITDKPIY